SLPFEEPWYRRRGVPATYLGHPYFDELAAQRLDAGLLARQRGLPGTVVGLLPGSRNHEVADNLGTLLGAAARIHAARPDTRFLIACLRPDQRDRVMAQLPQSPAAGLPVEVVAGRTPEVIHLSHLCLAVSGSVGLELLHHGKPSVVVYRTSRVNMLLKHVLLTVPHISLVNLLAGRELFPELLSARCQPEEAAAHALHWLNDAAAYEATSRELAQLRARVAEPGACARAAAFLLSAVRKTKRVRAA
ncbi:MAG TPA: lipid-A-disaccharide synthetase, partial [Gemmataceae bacterium]|nr:lipid-A-disaccharide synthetase [Gemmataceae bacterium]